MSIITDFFVANPEGLQSAFPGWMEVGARNRPVKNALTGEIQMTWAPVPTKAAAPPDRPASKGFLARLFGLSLHPRSTMPQTTRYAELFPTVQYKGVDIVKLCTLQAIVAGSTFDDALAGYDKPVLISPNDEEEQLYALPSALTKGLSSLAEDRLPDVAAKWAKTDELHLDEWSASDALEVIRALRSLARQAAESRVQVYHYWSL